MNELGKQQKENVDFYSSASLLIIDDTSKASHSSANFDWVYVWKKKCRPIHLWRMWSKYTVLSLYHANYACIWYTQNTSPETLAKLHPVRNSPRIMAVLAEESRQYFIIIEQAILCQVPTFFQALYILFCSYYAFHLHYPPQLQSVFFFLQDYILVYPDSVNRSSSYLAIATDINRYVNTAWGYGYVCTSPIIAIIISFHINFVHFHKIMTLYKLWFMSSCYCHYYYG